MQKALAILAMTGTLTFAGAGLAHATSYDGLAPATTTTLAQAEAEDDGDNTGLSGPRWPAGLLGLLGLKRRNDHVVAGPAATAGHRNVPPA